MSELQAKRGLSFSSDPAIEITIATNAGACFGVVRAIKLGFQAAHRAEKKADSRVYSLGALIHNPKVVGELDSLGVQRVESAESIDGGTVILRSHGVRREIEAELRAKGASIVDATCPLVKKPQRIAQSIGERGWFLVVVGDANHPEVKGVLSYFGRPDYLVTYDPAAVDSIPSDAAGVGVLAQTTIEASVFSAVAERVQSRFSDVSLYNTICDATSVRQSEANHLAEEADIVVVVGGKNSSNTTKLVKICKDRQPATYHVEDPSEIAAEWFLNKRKIAVTGGASTPHDVVDRAGQRIADLLGGSKA